MEKKFTPGPWRVCGEYRGICSCLQIWSTSDDIPVATTNMSNDEGVPTPTKERMIANAALIAAAPDLLEALELFTQALKGVPERWIIANGFEKPLTAARTAITKALTIK